MHEVGGISHAIVEDVVLQLHAQSHLLWIGFGRVPRPSPTTIPTAVRPAAAIASGVSSTACESSLRFLCRRTVESLDSLFVGSLRSSFCVRRRAPRTLVRTITTILRVASYELLRQYFVSRRFLLLK
jgi:hypothetical protein